MNKDDPRASGPDAFSNVEPGDEPRIAGHRFTNQDLPKQHQFAAWQDQVASMIDIWLPDHVRPEDGFIADHTLYSLGQITLMSETAGSFEVERPPAKFRAGDADHWVLSIHKEGRAVVETDGRVIEEMQGTFSLRSLTRPFRGKVTAANAAKVLSVHVPRDAFPEIAATLDSLNNTILSGGMNRILADYLLSLERNLSSIGEAERSRMAQMTETMIVGCLAPSLDSVMAAQEGIRATLIEQAQSYIRRNLRSPSLSPTEICRALNVSRSQLYRLFEASGGIANQIRTQRLIASHAVLADPRQRRRIHEIAHDFGFSSADEFSRAFRREFGYSPREAREMGIMRTANRSFSS
ncbi:MAG TPA: helix-turn-helix domain-containing protein [Afipia sp.]